MILTIRLIQKRWVFQLPFPVRMETPRFLVQRAATWAPPCSAPYRASTGPSRHVNRSSRQRWTPSAAEPTPKVSYLLQRLGGFADQSFQAFSNTWGHVLVTISGEVNSIAVGHPFNSFNLSAIEELVEAEVTQHESITLKFVTPMLTRCLIISVFSRTKPDMSCDL